MIKIPQPEMETAPAEDEPKLVEMALSPVPKSEEIVPAKNEMLSVEQARQNSIASLLANAYQRASTLKLTAKESEELLADFPDADFQRGAGGKQELIYLEHRALRDRFNSVLGVGQWAIIPMRHWSEPFRTAKGGEGEVVYREVVLLVRGCAVGTATGSMSYFKDNAAQNYGDAFEGAKTAAFRLCAKEMGVGLQAYSKDFCERWNQKYKGFERPTR